MAKPRKFKRNFWTMTEVFQDDLKHSTPYTLQMWWGRSWKEKIAEKFIRPLKSQL